MAEAIKFTEKTLDYAKNPRNQGDMADPTAIGEVSNPDCGDSTIIYLKVEDDIIKDVTFETFGCAAAVASRSIQNARRGRSRRTGWPAGKENALLCNRSRSNAESH